MRPTVAPGRPHEGPRQRPHAPEASPPAPPWVSPGQVSGAGVAGRRSPPLDMLSGCAGPLVQILLRELVTPAQSPASRRERAAEACPEPCPRQHQAGSTPTTAPSMPWRSSRGCAAPKTASGGGTTKRRVGGPFERDPWTPKRSLASHDRMKPIESRTTDVSIDTHWIKIREATSTGTHHRPDTVGSWIGCRRGAVAVAARRALAVGRGGQQWSMPPPLQPVCQA